MKLGYEEIRRREAALKQHFLDHINHDKIELYTPSVNSPIITFNMLNNQKQIIDAQDIEYYLVILRVVQQKLLKLRNPII